MKKTGGLISIEACKGISYESTDYIDFAHTTETNFQIVFKVQKLKVVCDIIK